MTLEVSQLEMSALKVNKKEKSQLMSVMAETSQSAMGPNIAMAAVGSVLYAWSAVFRVALVVKVVACTDGDSGGEGDGGGGEGDAGQVPGPQLEP